MTKVIDLNKVKDKKLYKRFIEDIDKLLHILTTSQQALSFYKHYTSAQEIISVIETNKTLLELNRKRYEKKLSKDAE